MCLFLLTNLSGFFLNETLNFIPCMLGILNRVCQFYKHIQFDTLCFLINGHTAWTHSIDITKIMNYKQKLQMAHVDKKKFIKNNYFNKK